MVRVTVYIGYFADRCLLFLHGLLPRINRHRGYSPRSKSLASRDATFPSIRYSRDRVCFIRNDDVCFDGGEKRIDDEWNPIEFSKICVLYSIYVYVYTINTYIYIYYRYVDPFVRWTIVVTQFNTIRLCPLFFPPSLFFSPNFHAFNFSIVCNKAIAIVLSSNPGEKNLSMVVSRNVPSILYIYIYIYWTDSILTRLHYLSRSIKIFASPARERSFSRG